MKTMLPTLLLVLAGCKPSDTGDAVKTDDVDGDGYTVEGGDCNDDNADVFPGAVEVYYDGVDEACDGDEEEFDKDLDGATQDVDCDDEDAAIKPGATETCNGKDDDCDGVVDVGAADGSIGYADADGDTFGDAAVPFTYCDGELPEGYVVDNTDCDDTEVTTYPGAYDACGNGVDEDCDGADSTAESNWYLDVDADGYGDPATVVSSCLQPEGYIAIGEDCDDADPALSPAAAEVCDGIDQDCDGTADDGIATVRYFYDGDLDGYGATADFQNACAQPEGYIAAGGDCDDSDSAINPGAAEVCDGVDQDCDGTADDGVIITYYDDDDGDGYGPTGTRGTGCTLPEGKCLGSGDCDDDDASLNPGAAEICDGVDQDCDRSIDEGVIYTYFDDDDADGYGDLGTKDTGCELPAGKVTEAGDCDDDDASVNPGEAELCDGLDNDCDKATDDHGGCFDTGGARGWYDMSVTTASDGSFDNGSFSVDFIGNLTGLSACAATWDIAGTDPSTSSCPDCEWSFALTFGTGTTAGDHCADIDMTTFLTSFDSFSADWGFSSDFTRRGVAYGEAILYRSSTGWVPVFTDYSTAYPDGDYVSWDGTTTTGTAPRAYYETYDRY